MNIQNQILSVATAFEGLVETISNQEWDDPKTPGPDQRAKDFEAMLKRAGHEDGWAYCMSYCEGIWRTAYKEAGATGPVLERISKLLNPSVMGSYNACNDAGLISKVPVAGAIMFMQNGKKWTGHAGIVESHGPEWVSTIEANTSPSDPNERDGGAGTGGVWRKRRALNLKSRKSGLWIRGFIHPIAVFDKNSRWR